MPRDVIFTDTCEAGRFIIAFLSFSLFSLSSPCDGNTILVEVHDFQLHECWMEPDKEKLFWQEMCFGESMSNCLTWCIFEFLTFPWLDAVDAGCSPISQRQHSSNLKKPRNFYKIFPIEMSMWSAILQKLLKVDIPRCHGFPFWSTWGPMMPGLFRKWSTFSKLAWKGSASVVGGLVAFRLPIDLLYFVVMLPLLGITMVGLALPSLPQLQLHGVALDGCSSATCSFGSMQLKDEQLTCESNEVKHFQTTRLP